MRNLAARPYAILMTVVTLAAAGAASAAARFPYTGEVTGENVYVRSGPDSNYYPVVKLHRGDRVTVLAESFGWLKIVPPRGCFSCVDKAFVQRQDGVGYITADRVWVRAGSLLVKDRSSPQTKLNRGDKVTILGEEGGFYKIAPPANAYLWISARYVRRVSRTQAPAAKPKPAVEPAVAKPVAKPKAPTTAPAVVTTQPAGAAQTQPATQPAKPAWQKQLDEIEAAVKAELAKPLLQRTWGPLIERYKPLAAQDQDAAVAAIAKARIKQLAAQIRMQDACREVQKVDSVLKEQLRAAEERAKTIQPPSPKAIRGWDAVGVLERSWLFTGRAIPKLYRVSDPETEMIVAYVQPTEALADRLEMLVGRASEHIYKPQWHIFVLVPEEVAKIPRPAPPATQPAAETPATQPAE